MRAVWNKTCDLAAEVLGGAIFIGIIMAPVVALTIALREMAPVTTAIFAIVVVVQTLNAGWFTATMIVVGLVAYIVSFVLLPVVGPIAAQAMCGSGLVVCTIAWGRSMISPQERCLVAA